MGGAFFGGLILVGGLIVVGFQFWYIASLAVDKEIGTLIPEDKPVVGEET